MFDTLKQSNRFNSSIKTYDIRETLVILGCNRKKAPKTTQFRLKISQFHTCILKVSLHGGPHKVLSFEF